MRTLESIIYCYRVGFDKLIKEKVNADKIKKMIEVYTKACEHWCTRSFGGIYIGNYDPRNLDIGDFNKIIDEIFICIREMDKLGIVKLNEFRERDSYKVYPYFK